jgi:N-acylneuraminate cytidylyltransferase
MKIALIPARGGSKRIPRKNIAEFHGKPMIAWSIEAALGAGFFDRIVTSTDNEEIADIARQHGAEVPWMRPAALADDHATTLEVIAHGLNALESDGASIEALCCLYATAPFVRAADLVAGYEALSQSEASYVFAAAEFSFPPQRGFTRDAQGFARMVAPEHMTTRSQDLEPVYHDAGQFYWCRPDAVRAGEALLGPRSLPLIMERARVQDIDTPGDWAFAEALFALLAQQSEAA